MSPESISVKGSLPTRKKRGGMSGGQKTRFQWGLKYVWKVGPRWNQQTVESAGSVYVCVYAVGGGQEDRSLVSGI